MLRRVWCTAWIGGAVMTLALAALTQDAYGLEGYISTVRAHWLTPVVSVPLAMALLGAALWLMVRAASAEADRDETRDRLIRVCNALAKWKAERMRDDVH